MSNDPDGRTAAQEAVFDSSLLPFPLGDPGRPSAPRDLSSAYDNRLLYLFAFLAVWLVPVFGPVALGVAAYRIWHHRPHAWRGAAVAVLATALGVAVVAWYASAMGAASA